MRKSLLAASALVCVAALASTAAQADATYVLVAPPAGATSTTVFGINDSNIVAGSYQDLAGTEHGFYGPMDGSNYTTFDFGHGKTGTEPRAISNDGNITGLALGGVYQFGEEFFRDAAGKLRAITKDGAKLDGVAQGFDNRNQNYVGDYLDSGVRTGYIGKKGKYRDAVTLPVSATSTNPRGENYSGVIAGGYFDTAGIQHGFTLDRSGGFNSFDYPDAAGVTTSEGINDSGVVSGLWQDTAANRHGFVLDTATSTFTLIDGGDGSDYQQVWGINNAGLVAVNTRTAGGPFTSYIYCPLPADQCPVGGRTHRVKVHQIHVAAGTFLHYDRNGRTGHETKAAVSKYKSATP